jgi:hypothetical protein
MKYFFIFLLTGLCLFNLNAQIPNSGFENWSDGEPDNWFTNNLPGTWITVSSSGTSQSGSFAAKIEVADFNGGPIYPALSTTFPISQDYGSLNGYYQFHPTINEMILIGLAYTFKDGILVGIGVVEIESASSNYSQFSSEIIGNGQIPDSIMIQFQILSDSPTDPGIGSYAFIDQISFGQSTNIDDNSITPLEFTLEQNYPNPFNPSTVIRFSIPQNDNVMLRVFDLLGKEVVTLINEFKLRGVYEYEFNVSDLASGIYFYKLQSGDFVKTKKMIITK